jgi:hypothetical protein
MTAEPRNGRIVTFYSYKGGTGRSMALTNVGWILASSGKRVLLIDWDLEAPGLHRYLHPFIGDDKELATTEGLMDFFVNFTEAARVAHSQKADEKWYESSASLVRYSLPVTWDFGAGALELVPAGRQDAGYATRVTSFNWTDFYDRLGGGVFLEALKKRLRHDYDFVLIDSRTGISDTSGICTIQMPDDLVVLFTLNQQSIKGAYAVADSAEGQRLKSTGEPGLRIWPVTTRVDPGEEDKANAGRKLVRETFQRFVKRLPREQRPLYWGHTEVPYKTYYAYEEILCTFVDLPDVSNTMLAPMKALASRLAGETISFDMSEAERTRGRALFERRVPTDVTSSALAARPLVYISYSQKSKATTRAAEQLAAELDHRGIDTWWDRNLRPGDDFQAELDNALGRSTVLLSIGDRNPIGDWRLREASRARDLGKRIIPVLIDAMPEDLPPILKPYIAVVLRSRTLRRDIVKAVNDLESLLRSSPARPPSSTIDTEDPNKGQFGGSNSANGRVLLADVERISEDWFRVKAVVRATDVPLSGEVKFYLHKPTFPNPVRTVMASKDKADYEFSAWGAFTLGATTDDGRTTLELDLATLTGAPPVFTSR